MAMASAVDEALANDRTNCRIQVFGLDDTSVMRMMKRAWLPAVLLLIGCRLHNRPLEPEVPRWPTRDSLFVLDQSRGDSVSAGGVAGELAFIDSNIIYLRAGLPTVYKRSAVRSLFEAAHPSRSYIWQPLGGDVSRDLQSGYTYGIAARNGNEMQPSPHIERYVAFWQRRGAPARWRIVAYAEVGGQSGPEIKLSSTELSLPERQLSKEEAETTIGLRLADSSFSDEADRLGLPYAFSHMVARDGAVFAGTRLIVGPEAISEALATQSRGTSITWRPLYASVAGSGDLGFTVGDYISTGPGPSGAAVQRFGKYLSVWRRQDGSWKLLMSSGNATPARAPQ